jgi:WD40 repeat protein
MMIITSAILIALQTNSIRLADFQRKGYRPIIRSVAIACGKPIIAVAVDDGSICLVEKVNGEFKHTSTIAAHRGRIFGVAVSNDGSLVASCGEDRLVQVYDRKKGSLRKPYSGHLNRVVAVAFSPDGKSMISSSHDDTVRLWETSTGKEIAKLEGRTSGITSLTYSLDGKRVIGGGRDSRLVAWDIESRQVIATSEKLEAPIASLVRSPSGDTLVTAGIDGEITVWDPKTGKKNYTLTDHKHGVFCLAFSPDGKSMISCGSGMDLFFLVWELSDPSTKRKISTERMVGHAVLVDSNTVIGGTSVLQLWDLENRREPGEIELTASGAPKK